MGKASRERRERERRRIRVTETERGALLTVGLGVEEEITNPHRPLNVEPGEHLWVVVAAWRVDPSKLDATVRGSGLGVLDHENMLSVDGPGCFVCERTYSPEVAARPCPGDPNGLPLT